MNKYLIEILEEMFSRVELEFNMNFILQPEWYLKYSWTEQQEDEFIEWLIEYMLKNKDARDELMIIPYKNKKFIKEWVNEFILNYGWRTQ